MASDNASVVTSSTLARDAPVIADDLTRAKSLKRTREITPTPSPSATPLNDLSPAKIARLVGYTTQAQSPPSSSAAAHEEKRRRRAEEQATESSLNLLQTLEEAMSGATAAMSRPQEPPRPHTQESVEAPTAATVRALASVQIPTESNVGDPQEISPSAGSAVTAGSLEDGESQVVHSPAAMDVDPQGHQRMYTAQPEAPMEDKAASSLSYPGLPGASMPAPAHPQRGMSMPMTSTQNPDLAPRSPSSKKHKCPYCETEFTRHHNLKSHLLTHSQEKPYVCQQCQMRFRRLHDLKRHSKLHTGEKPHICPKCDRKFARGDALARHSKGAGGCAGRRPSMGSFGGEEDFGDGSMVDGDDSMTGVLYGSANASLTEEDRRLSMPSIKTQHVAGQHGQEGVAHSNTYPPNGPRPAGGLYPPNIDRGSAGSATSPSLPNSHTPHTSISSMPLSAGSTSVFSQSGMTESPKPLSPGGAQANQAGQKRAASQQSGSGLSMPSHGMSQAAAWRSQYPPADGKQHEANAAAAAAGRGRGRGASGTGQRNGTGDAGAGPDPTILAYVRHLDDKITKLTADLEAKAQRETQLLERMAEQDQHIGILVAQLADLRAALQPQLAPVPQDDAPTGQE
ncbi:hypothetical protein OQA88_6728 [Cercophora sp. LCS_1]